MTRTGIRLIRLLTAYVINTLNRDNVYHVPHHTKIGVSRPTTYIRYRCDDNDDDDANGSSANPFPHRPFPILD